MPSLNVETLAGLYLIDWRMWFEPPMSVLTYMLLAVSGGLMLLLVARDLKVRWDRQRITRQITQQGWTLLEIRPVWTLARLFGRQAGRSYWVAYRLGDGREITAYCATSLFTGVKWESYTPPGSPT